MISRKIKIKKNGKRFLNVYFSRFLDVSAANADALLAALKPAPEGGGVVLFGGGSGGPSHSILKVSWVSVLPASCLLMVGNKKNSAGARSGE